MVVETRLVPRLSDVRPATLVGRGVARGVTRLARPRDAAPGPDTLRAPPVRRPVERPVLRPRPPVPVVPRGVAAPARPLVGVDDAVDKAGRAVALLPGAPALRDGPAAPGAVGEDETVAGRAKAIPSPPAIPEPEVRVLAAVGLGLVGRRVARVTRSPDTRRLVVGLGLVEAVDGRVQVRPVEGGVGTGRPRRPQGSPPPIPAHAGPSLVAASADDAETVP